MSRNDGAESMSASLACSRLNKKAGSAARALSCQRVGFGRTMRPRTDRNDAASDFLQAMNKRRFRTILADPPWQFTNRTGKMAPEHRRLSRYVTMALEEIMALPVGAVADELAHLYLWVPNALLPEGLAVMRAWGFSYKANVVWHKILGHVGRSGFGRL